jgi:hypothetical protein
MATGIIKQVMQQESQLVETADQKGGDASAPAPNKGFQIPKTKATDREDLTRMTGDIAVYKYYLKSVGWSRAMIYLGFVLLDVFGENFSRMSRIPTGLHQPCLLCCTNTPRRVLVEDVGGRRRR